MKAFWRDSELDDDECYLLGELWEAHHASCFRDNASSVAVKVAADASGDLSKAFIAGLSTLGANHAPIEKTVWFLQRDAPAVHVADFLKIGKKIPGWGGTYQNDQTDPLWKGIDLLIRQYYPNLYFKLESVTETLKAHGRMIQPNPSAYTACVAIALQMPAELAPYLFINMRIGGWAEIAFKHLRKT
jgi:citrate synthase